MENSETHRGRFSLARVARALLIVLGVVLPVALHPLIASFIKPWRLASTSEPVSLGYGATFVTKSLKGPVDTEFHLVFFDTRLCDLRVVEQPVKKDALSLDKVAGATAAIAACNGGYFDVPNFLPSGLQIVGGKQQGELVRQTLSGCVVVRSDDAQLIPSTEIADVAGVTDFIQCSPIYVMDGRAMQIGAGGPRNTRTFVLTDQAGHWAVGTCKNITLQEMADVLAKPDIITEFPVKRALNLDGGPSTALWWKDEAGVAHYEKESWRVKNMLLIMPKK